MGNVPTIGLSALGSEFALNIYAELLGIALTVFLIDRLLAWREERKWRTATDINLRRLVRVTNGTCLGFGERVGLSMGEVGLIEGKSPPSIVEGSRILAERMDDSLRDEAGVKARVAAWTDQQWIDYRDELHEARTTLVEILTSFGGRLHEETTSSAYALIQAIDTYESGIELAEAYRREKARRAGGREESQAFLAGFKDPMCEAAFETAVRALALKRRLHTHLPEQEPAPGSSPSLANTA